MMKEQLEDIKEKIENRIDELEIDMQCKQENNPDIEKLKEAVYLIDDVIRILETTYQCKE